MQVGSRGFRKVVEKNPDSHNDGTEMDILWKAGREVTDVGQASSLQLK